MPPNATRRPGELVFAVLSLLASLFLFWNAYRISGFSQLSAPGSFPIAATSVMVLASIVVVIRTLAMPAGARGLAAVRTQVLPPLLIVFSLFIIAYGVLLERLGFVITSLAFLFVSIWLLYRRGPRVAAGWAALSIIVVYVVFRLVFQVVLPEGVVPERRIMAVIGDFFARGGPR